MIRRITSTLAAYALIISLTLNCSLLSGHTPPTSPTTPPTEIIQPEPVAEPAPSQYEIVRKELVQSVNEYINANYPKSKLTGEAIVRACETHDFDICFALAQAEIESHFGTRGVAARTNSPWNVGAFDGRTSADMNSKGLGYKHPNHSIEPYIKLVKTKYLGKHKTVNDLMVKYVSLKGYRYASNPQYERSLSNKYKFICRTTRINTLQDTLRTTI